MSLVFGCQAFDSSDPTAVLKEALLLFLPGADVAAGGRDLLAQARFQTFFWPQKSHRQARVLK